MNWKRGLFRLWALFAAVWFLSVSGVAFDRWYNDPWRVVSETPKTKAPFDPSKPYTVVPPSDLPSGIEQRGFDPDKYLAEKVPDWAATPIPNGKKPMSWLEYLVLAFGVPTGVLGAAVAGWWAKQGFKP